MFVSPEHCHLLAMNLRNKKGKHLHIGVNVKIPELIYSFFFFFFFFDFHALWSRLVFPKVLEGSRVWKQGSERWWLCLAGGDDRTGGSGCFHLLNLWLECGKKGCHLFYWYLLGETHYMLLHTYVYVHVRFFRALDECLLYSILKIKIYTIMWIPACKWFQGVWCFSIFNFLVDFMIA